MAERNGSRKICSPRASASAAIINHLQSERDQSGKFIRGKIDKLSPASWHSNGVGHYRPGPRDSFRELAISLSHSVLRGAKADSRYRGARGFTVKPWRTHSARLFVFFCCAALITPASWKIVEEIERMLLRPRQLKEAGALDIRLSVAFAIVFYCCSMMGFRLAGLASRLRPWWT